MRLIGLAVVLAISLILAPLAPEAQRAATAPRIGLLGVPPLGDATYRALLQGLQELGYAEGKDVLIEFRSGETRRLPELASELVRLKVDVIATFGSPAAQAATRALIFGNQRYLVDVPLYAAGPSF